MPSSAPPRRRLLAQALVVMLSLGLAELMARSLGLERAAGVLCLSSLASLVVCGRLGWRQALMGVAGLAVLSVPAVVSQNDPLLATLVLTTTALGLGLSARWQLKPVYWLLVVSLCILITNSPLPANPPAADVGRLALALLASGSLATLLQAGLQARFDRVSAQAPFAVAHSWRRSAAHGVMLAAAALVTTPIALQHHWHTSGLWLIITPFLVLQPFVRDSWRVALHRSLGTLAGVLLVLLIAVTLPRSVPLDLVAIATAVITGVIAFKHGHRALMLTALTVTIVLFNSSDADLMLMADKRVVASAIGITIALSLMALAQPIERRLARSAQG
jgi:uncharacterized membrane protein YccC